METHDFMFTNRWGRQQSYWVCSKCWIDKSIKIYDECGEHMFNDPEVVMSVKILKRPLKKVPTRDKYYKYRATCPARCDWRVQAEWAAWTVFARRKDGAYEIRVTDMKTGKHEALCHGYDEHPRNLAQANYFARDIIRQHLQICENLPQIRHE